MTTVTLPALPDGKEFEEFVAAYFQCAGHYVERNVIDRQEEEVLELDIIVSTYDPNVPPSGCLIEVKSGGWGFTDIFKMRGWLDYIRMKRGALIVRKPAGSMDLYQKIADAVQITVLPLTDLGTAAAKLEPMTGAAPVHAIDSQWWRLSYWAERQTLRRLTVRKKSVQDKKCYVELDRYFSLINNKTFFTQNVIERAAMLYETFKEFPNISAKLAHELQGGDFDGEYDSVPKAIFKEAYYTGKSNGLELSTFVEHRARLAVMKAAIDYQLFKQAGVVHDVKHAFEFGDQKSENKLLDMLPQSFRSGLRTISSHPYFHRYPVFWQWFLWFFGGFILKDYEAKEYEFLSTRTGIPIEHIPQALDSYNVLFPSDDGWFMEHHYNNARVMKLFPMPFMGVGAKVRKWLHGGDKGWDGLKTTGQDTVGDLIKWNNSLDELLSWKG